MTPYVKGIAEIQSRLAAKRCTSTTEARQPRALWLPVKRAEMKYSSVKADHHPRHVSQLTFGKMRRAATAHPRHRICNPWYVIHFQGLRTYVAKTPFPVCVCVSVLFIFRSSCRTSGSCTHLFYLRERGFKCLPSSRADCKEPTPWPGVELAFLGGRKQSFFHS